MPPHSGTKWWLGWTLPKPWTPERSSARVLAGSRQTATSRERSGQGRPAPRCRRADRDRATASAMFANSELSLPATRTAASAHVSPSLRTPTVQISQVSTSPEVVGRGGCKEDARLVLTARLAPSAPSLRQPAGDSAIPSSVDLPMNYERTEYLVRRSTTCRASRLST
jgi:hypothetical protein